MATYHMHPYDVPCSWECRAWSDGLKAQARAERRRPWFWWLALGIVAALFAVEFWLVYRAVAGWPVEGLTLLTRMAG